MKLKKFINMKLQNLMAIHFLLMQIREHFMMIVVLFGMMAVVNYFVK